MTERVDGTTKRTRRSSISFGTVAMYKFDTTAKARRAVSVGSAVPKRVSVEEFERFHRTPVKKSKTPLASTLRTYDESRSERLERLRRQIEATLDATDSFMLEEGETFSGSNQASNRPLVLTKKNKDERWVASSSIMASGDASLGCPTKSNARLSQLHLSRLNLTASANTTVAQPPNGTGTKNAVFPDMAAPLSHPDAAPKRPMRKRSRDCLVTEETHAFHRKSAELGVDAPAAITLRNATWESHVRPGSKRSLDCLLQKTFAPLQPDAADTGNAVW